MSDDHLSVSLLDQGQILDIVHGRQHWLVVFGPSACADGLIDSLDDYLAHYPTYPTIMGPVPMTVIPKSEVSWELLERWLTSISSRVQPRERQEQDILPIVADEGEVAMVMGFFHFIREMESG